MALTVPYLVPTSLSPAYELYLEIDEGWLPTCHTAIPESRRPSHQLLPIADQRPAFAVYGGASWNPKSPAYQLPSQIHVPTNIDLAPAETHDFTSIARPKIAPGVPLAHPSGYISGTATALPMGSHACPIKS